MPLTSHILSVAAKKFAQNSVGRIESDRERVNGAAMAAASIINFANRPQNLSQKERERTEEQGRG